MFGMLISGMMMSLLGGHAISFYNLFTIEPLAAKHPLSGTAHEIHWILSYMLIGVFATHTSGALYHHFIRRDHVLKRMLPGKRS
jgi:cytochrome b561